VIPVRRILLLEPDFYGSETLFRLREANVEPVCAKCETTTELANLLKNAADSGTPFFAIFTRLGLAHNAEIMAAAGPSLRYIVTPTTGLGHIDTEEAFRLGIEVLSLKGNTEFLRSITSTAEMAFCLLLALVRKLPAAHSDVINHQWRRDPFRGRELRGMTLGIVGLGRLGTMMAGYGKAFGMKVIADDSRPEPFLESCNAHVEQKTITALLSESDVVSVHLPLEAETVRFLNAARIAAMKPRSWLINTARGEIVDEISLLKALKSGHLAGCALDVLDGDSRWDRGVPEDHPLISYAQKHDNLLLTPHIGGYSLDAITRTRAYMVDRFCKRLAQN
jgi:D-3-phosphoglycerate dehydrogenase / 2-oxoglutarate reductase